MMRRLCPRRLKTRATEVVVSLAAIAVACSPRISEDDLAKRIASSEVRWNNYQEDLKAQIGAAPAAEWRGAPVTAHCESNAVTIAFQLEGPWAARHVAIPVLVRDPLGNVVREADASQTTTGVDYRFAIDASWTESPVPWVELQFPGNETRIVFREDGTWRSHR